MVVGSTCCRRAAVGRTFADVWTLGRPLPLSALLSAVGWFRSPHDAVLWAGFGLNALLVVGLIALLLGLFTGDVGVGYD
jgi:CHASE2 domain-containing sensor protein